MLREVEARFDDAGSMNDRVGAKPRSYDAGSTNDRVGVGSGTGG